MKRSESYKFQDVSIFKFGSYPFGEPTMFVHVYYVDGLLIDTGHVNMRREICSTLSELSVDKMVVTHHHEDHSGNIDAVKTLFNCPVYASEDCVTIMKSPPPISPAQMATWGKYDPFFEFEILGDQLKTNRCSFDIIPIPGHASDMVALHEPNQGWLFSADLYVYHRIKYFMRSESMSGQIESIKKVLDLNFDQMFCSHNPILNGDPKLLLQQKLQFLEDFYQRVAELNDKGISIGEIFKRMKLKESWFIKIFSLGGLSTKNMVRAVLRDEARTV